MAVDPTELEAMADADLFALIETIRALVDQRQQARQQEAADREQAIRDAVADLDALIGPDNPVKTANPSTIAEMKLFTEAELQAHTGKAHWLSVRGLDIIARTVRDIAAAR